MKKMILAALAMAVTLPAATSVYAQYDDDIYFSSSSAERYEPVRETVVEEWSTNANNDWDIDSYNRRTSDVALSSTSSDTYAQSVTENRHQNFSFGTEPESAPENIIHDTVYVVENYYYTDRIRRFHNPWFSYHIWNPYWDVAYWDPFYWDYCYWDPWWYVTPSFGFHYGSWYWGWNYGYYTGWYGGWYSPFYRPFPHYYGPAYAGGGHHGWHSRPNQGPRTNNMGGSYARNSRNGARRPANRQYTADARRSGIEGGGASYSTRGGAANANRNSNLRLNNDQISRISGTRSDSRNLTTGGTTVRGNRSAGGSSTRSMVGSSGSTATNNSNARRQANGVRQNSSGRTYRSTERAASSSNSFNRNTSRSGNYSSGSRSSYNRSSGSYSSSSSSSSNSSTSTRSYTPSTSSGSSYSGSRSGGSSSGSFGGRSGGSSGSFGGRSGGGRR